MAESKIQMQGWLPGEQMNGLQAIAGQLSKIEPPDTVLVLAKVERKKRTEDDVTGDVTAQMRMTHVEVLEGDLAQEGASMMRAAYEQRTGEATLPEPEEMDL